jgi:alpha,alpha-trehalose phosphorylase
MSPQLEPWVHRETGWSSDGAAESETMLALSNGYLGVRGTLDEGAPAAHPGTYLAGLYETRPIPYADRGAGDPETDQVIVDATDGTRIALTVEGEPLDLRTGTLLAHERVLDVRAGLLVRTLRWRSPAGREVAVRSRRLVSLAHREMAAIAYEVEALGRPLRLTVQSDLAAGGAGRRRSVDPRAGGVLPSDTLVPRGAHRDRGRRALLVHQTRRSGHVLAAGMDHQVVAGDGFAETLEADGSLARWQLTGTAEPGRPIELVKLLAYHWAPPDGDPAEGLVSATRRSLDEARGLGFDRLAREQRAALDEVWGHADIELDGDPEVQHALRYALFQLHQNAACAEGRGIPAKGLTGPGYNGHTFWDTEIFLLPVLSYCAPRHAEDVLRWRASTLPQARAKASQLGLRGAAFAWRTIAGEECSGYLPAGTAAFHVNAAIAHAVAQHVEISGDERFERETAAPLLIETARMWASLGYHDERHGGRFSIDGVTGPDEYSTLVDNNLYTNLMAQANLRAAAELVDRIGINTLAVEPHEVVAWRRAADAMTIPYDNELGIHLQDEDFTRHARLDLAAIPPDHYPLLLHIPYFQLYRHQVVKQPDLVLAMALRGDAFTDEQKRRNLAYYEPLTVRDSSLSAGTQAVLAAEVGDTQLAYDYLAEAILLDHHNTARNTADGLHLAALAGGWIAVIDGLAGMREHNRRLSFNPRLPDGIERIAFPLTFRGRQLRIEITPTSATYTLHSGPALEIEHWGTLLTIHPVEPTRAPMPTPLTPPELRQPPGRAPERRRAGWRQTNVAW